MNGVEAKRFSTTRVEGRPARRHAHRGAVALSCAAALRGLVVSALLALPLSLAVSAPAHARDNNATQALTEFRGKKVPKNVIQNKFFLKSNRFELAPMIGYVPNNAFVDNYVGGAVLAYHFSETLAAEGNFFVNPLPATIGVKNLTKTLLDIAYQGDQNTTFQQPLDSLFYSAVFSARFAPVYGKINLVGNGVINFDVYGTAGLGIVGISKNVATVSDDYKTSGGVNADGTAVDPVALNPTPPIDNRFAFNLGVGFDFFLSQSVALKLDARALNYVGPEADYGNTDPKTGDPIPLKDELHSAFITTAGISIFIPKMKPRVFNF